MNMHTEEHIIVIQSITEALFKLMETKSFSEISVTELISKAGVARSTYYRNFSSKEDIIKLYFKNIFKDLNEKYPISKIDDLYTTQYVENVLNYLPRYKKNIEIINNAGISSLFLSCLNDYMLSAYGGKRISQEESYLLYALAGAEYNLIFNWYMKKEFHDTTSLVRFLSEFINKHRTKPTYNNQANFK